jgi:hypothetical protein
MVSAVAVEVGVGLVVVEVGLDVAFAVAIGSFSAIVALGVAFAVAVNVAEAVAAGCAIVSRMLYVFSTSSPGMDEKLKMRMAKKSAGHQRSQVRWRLEKDKIVILPQSRVYEEDTDVKVYQFSIRKSR